MEKIAGIYKIVNLVNGKIYIGSSNDLKTRKRGHFSCLNRHIHANKHLQSAFNKYGKDSFLFKVIEYIDNKDDLLIREQYWINTLNVCDNTIGYNQNPIVNKPPSFNGKKWKEESILKISKSVKNIDTNKIFISAIEASRFYNIDSSSITKCCKGKRFIAGGYRWRYA